MLKIKNMNAWRLEMLSFLVITGLILVSWVFLQVAGSNLQTIERTGLDTAVIAQQELQTLDAPIELATLLDPILNNVQKDFPGRYSISVTSLESKETARLNADVIQKSASLYKLFVANEALKMVDNEKLSLSQIIDTERNLNLEQCLEIVIRVSDNGCGVILQRITGATNRELPQLEKQGLLHTDLRGVYPSTSAGDVDQFYQNLIDRNYLSETSASFLELQLANQQINDRIPVQLPEEISVSHKTADLEGYLHDAGIVYGGNEDYIIVIMTQPQSGAYTERYSDMAKISRSIFDALN